jgi:hypothetical protein
MHLKLAVMIVAVSVACAPAATQKKTAKKATPATQAVTIPKDAVPNSDGISYAWTDKQGKRWTFTKTPFGILKAPVTEAAAAAPPADMSGTKAIDKGDTVRFERPGPFGVASWEKKKTDLTDDERRLLESQNAKTE